jgi:NAD+ kinase
VKRVLLLTHREPAVTESTLPAILAILDEVGVQVLIPAGEVVKHRLLTGYQSSDGMGLRPGGEDLILVLGGDGSILRALAREAGSGAPVIGVNYGRVGFLASIERETLERDLRRALAGEYVVLGLPSLKAEWSEGEVQAVNDLALFRSGEARIADLTYEVDGELVATVRCDGVVLSTPVGSTAYNLAAGGPILHPTLPAVVVTPICPHMLANRPLVVSDDSKVELRLRAAREVEVYAALDGQETFALTDDDGVVVTGSPRRLKLVKAPGRDYYEVLRSKLKWGDGTLPERPEP